MELREALTQISEIRAQVARTEMFRGYRSLTVAFTGLLAFCAAPVVAQFGEAQKLSELTRAATKTGH